VIWHVTVSPPLVAVIVVEPALNAVTVTSSLFSVVVLSKLAIASLATDQVILPSAFLADIVAASPTS
jgi:hypothetical protein